MRSDNACTLVDRLQESIFIHSFGEFGEAAARYPTLKLEDVCSLITDGEHQTPLRSDSGVKLLSARNIRNGKLDFSDVDFVPMEEFARIGRRCAPVRGDVLISCSGSIGRVAVVDTDEPLAMVRSAAMARPIQAKVRPFYLEILLRSRHLQQCMQKSANASSQANLFQGKIRALPVFLPSLEEQDAFVARASKARASAHILASRVIELQALMQSAQNAAFSGGIQQ
jgi:type I restriction enzyme S subunit